ncbi:MAG: TonB-dependent siderophore receptor [Geminicoccaceae bacterium]
MSGSRWWRAALAGTSLAAINAVALAQDHVPTSPADVGGEPAETTVLPPVQVSETAATGAPVGFVATQTSAGTKTDTPISEIPQSVSVITREQMDRQGVQTVDQVGRYTPGVLSQPFGPSTRADWIYIRGFDATQTGLFLDGLQLYQTAFASWRIDPFALESVDVLRGPSSMVYGASSPGGLFNLVLKRPTAEPLRHVESGFDNFGQKYGAVDVGGPIDEEGKLLYRFTTRGHFGDTDTDHDEYDGFFVAPSFSWRPNEDTNLTVHSMFQKSNAKQSNGFLPYEGTVTRTEIGRIAKDLYVGNPHRDKFNQDQFILGYELDHRFSDTWSLRQNAQYSYVNVFGRQLYPYGYNNPEQTELYRINFKTSPEAHLFAIDNTAVANFSTGPLEHELLTGIDYKWYRIADDQSTAWTEQFPLDLLDPDYGVSTKSPYYRYIWNRQHIQDFGVYVQDQARFDENWVLTLGARYDWLSTETDDRLTSTTSSDSPGQASWRAGLNYLFDNGVTPYASFQTFFNPVPGVDASGHPFEPEDGQQYEVGIKYEPPGWNTLLSVAAFDLTRKNVLTPDPANPFNQVQKGEIRSRGLELEAVSSPLPGLNVIGAYTLMDLEVTESTGPDEGNVPVGVPESMASTWADYTIQSGPLAGAGAGLGVRWVGRSYADEANDLRVDDYLLTDAALYYERQGWRAAVNVTNLFDKTYVASCDGASSCFYGAGRQVLFSLGVTW